MTDWWYIVQTRPHSERRAANAIAAAGFEAWIPEEVINHRIGGTRRQRGTYTRLILPRTVFAALPEAVHGDFSDFEGIIRVQRDVASVALKIPAIAIRHWRLNIDNLNNAAIALARVGKPSKNKAQWRPLKEALMVLAGGSVTTSCTDSEL